jgi:hypothetical protein
MILFIESIQFSRKMIRHLSFPDLNLQEFEHIVYSRIFDRTISQEYPKTAIIAYICYQEGLLTLHLL